VIDMCGELANQRRGADFYNVCRTCPQGCCNGVRPPLSSRRMRLIESYLRANGLRIDNPFEIRDYVFPRETKDGYCIFFDRLTSRCTIHPVKPETCVAGPVTFDINPNTGKIEWFLKRDNICLLAGPLFQNKEAFGEHLKSAKREIRRLVRDMDAEKLRVILTIPEPDTFKIDEDPIELKVLEKLRL